MEIVINDDNLKNNDIFEFSTKVRAILIDDNNQILIANYGNVILLPGGKVDKGETNITAITRELREEVGQNYSGEELEYFTTLKFYQKNYPTRDSKLKNRLITTHYFIGKYKGISRQSLTEKELKGNFRLKLFFLEDIENIILENKNSNPRNIYFQKELLTILSCYKDAKQNKIVRKLGLKYLIK